jgi:hypothetical protein
MQEWFKTQKSINIIQHINGIKGKSHMIISIDVEKAFDKIQHLFMTKALNKVGIEGTYLNKIKDIYSKPITSNILIVERTEAISSKDRNKARVCTLCTFIDDKVLEFLARAIKQEAEIKRI